MNNRMLYTTSPLRLPRTEQEGLERCARLYAADPVLIGLSQTAFKLALQNGQTVTEAFATALDHMIETLSRVIEKNID